VITQCLDFIDDNFGIDSGMAELAKTLLPERVRPEALKRFQKIAKGRLESIIPALQSRCRVIQNVGCTTSPENETLRLWIPLNYS
jgi:hypothetical protein